MHTATKCIYDDGVVFSTLATELTTLLAMPVKLEKVGSHVRCLELRLRFSSGDAVYTTVAFRTDEDRQGEDRLVISWPPRIDPPPCPLGTAELTTRLGINTKAVLCP